MRAVLRKLRARQGLPPGAHYPAGLDARLEEMAAALARIEGLLQRQCARCRDWGSVIQFGDERIVPHEWQKTTAQRCPDCQREPDTVCIPSFASIEGGKQ